MIKIEFDLRNATDDEKPVAQRLLDEIRNSVEHEILSITVKESPVDNVVDSLVGYMRKQRYAARAILDIQRWSLNDGAKLTPFELDHINEAISKLVDEGILGTDDGVKVYLTEKGYKTIH